MEIAKAKLYGCIIYDGSEKIREFIPCYLKSTGTVGMYDMVNMQFYENAGTGTFIKGPDVN